MSKLRSAAVGCLFGVLLAVATGCAASKSTPAPRSTETPAACDPDRSTARLAYQVLRPSVVFVGVESDEGTGWATGFVVGDGEVLTNAHVVDGAREITLEFAGGGTAAAPIEDIRVDDQRDIAVMSVPTGGAPPVALEPASELEVGRDLIAVGYPALPGENEARIAGSAGDPTITSGLFNGVKQLRTDDWLEISVPIHPGNSGGPVSDLCGTVYGIATLYTDFESASFAVPSNDVQAFVTNVRSGGGDTVQVTRRSSDLPASLEDAFRAANLSTDDFPDGFVVADEQFAGGQAVPGDALKACTDAMGVLSTFRNDGAASASGPLITTAQSGVFTLPNLDAATGCFAQGSEIIRSEDFVQSVANSAGGDGVRVRVDGMANVDGPGVFEQEAALLVQGTFLFDDGRSLPFETVAFGFRQQTEVGIVAVYFVQGHDFEAVGELAGTLSVKMQSVFND